MTYKYTYIYIHCFITVYYVNVYVFQIVSILFHTLCNAMFSSSLQYMAMAKVCLQLPPWQKWNNTMYIKHSNKRWVSPSWDSHPKKWTQGRDSSLQALGVHLGLRNGWWIWQRSQIHKFPRSQVSWTNWQLPLGGGRLRSRGPWVTGHACGDVSALTAGFF